jgi:diketogulonate reductase-like aldo/keto reductase
LHRNEAEVGAGIRQSNVKREDIYVVTKTVAKGYKECSEAFKESNKRYSANK